MKNINIFEKAVSVFKTIEDKVPVANWKLGKALAGHPFEEQILKYRRTNDEKDKKALPLFTPSGTFKGRKDADLIMHSGIVCIDIDKKDNPNVENFNDFKSLVSEIPYVAYCGHSCSGEGYFALIPIQYPEKHKEHYLSICDDFERCNIKVDRKCINIARVRFFSVDKFAYINKKALVYSMLAEVSNKNTYNRAPQVVTKESFMTNQNKKNVEILLYQIEKDQLDITEERSQWFKIGAALANEFDEFGREFFHQFSKFYPKYNRNETDKEYDDCLKHRLWYKIGTLYHYTKMYGLKF